MFRLLMVPNDVFILPFLKCFHDSVQRDQKKKKQPTNTNQNQWRTCPNSLCFVKLHSNHSGAGTWLRKSWTRPSIHAALSHSSRRISTRWAWCSGKWPEDALSGVSSFIPTTLSCPAFSSNSVEWAEEWNKNGFLSRSSRRFPAALLRPGAFRSHCWGHEEGGVRHETQTQRSQPVAELRGESGELQPASAKASRAARPF